MEEKNTNSKEPNKIKIKVSVKTIIIIASILVVLLASNVFAGIMGYGNIFFMIKNIVAPGTASGKAELLSDSEIIISYSKIDVCDGISMQVNKMITENGKSSLYLNVKNTLESKNLNFKVKDENSKELGSQKFNIKKESKDIVINLSRVVNEDEKIILVVSSEEKVFRTLTIDLSKREIIVEGEDEIKKISEVELNKYLGCFAILDSIKDDKSSVLDSNYIIIVSKRLASDVLGITNLNREEINKIAESFAGKFLEKETTNDKSGNKVEIIKNANAYEYVKEKDEYKELTDESDVPFGMCVRIDNISYSNGIYKIDYIYCLTRAAELEESEVELYKSTIELKLNENSKYSKYQIQKFGTFEKIEKNVSDENINSKDEDKVLSEGKNENINTAKCDHEYQCKKVDKDYHTTLDGTHTLVCDKCGNTKEEKHNFGKWNRINYNTAWTLWCNDCLRYVYTNDYNVVLNSGYDILESQECDHGYDCKKADKDYHTTLDGTHTLVCTKCGNTKEEKHNFEEWNRINNNTAWTLWCNDCQRYVYTEDYNVVLNSGYDILESQGCDHKYQCKKEEVPNYTTLDGTHTLVCSKCGNTKEEKHNFEKWYKLYGNESWALVCKDNCNSLVVTEDYNEVLNSGYGVLGSQDCDHDYQYQKFSAILAGLEEEPTHVLKCKKCGDTKEEKHNFVKWNYHKDTKRWSTWCEDCKCSVYTDDYNVVLNSGFGVEETE